MATPDLAQDIPNVRHELIVERAAMGPDIAKADEDRYLDPGLSALDFCNKAMRRLVHGE